MVCAPLANQRTGQNSFAGPASDDHNLRMSDLPIADLSIKPALVGEKVLLRPFLVDQDIAALRWMLQDPEVGRLTGSIHGPADTQP
jgi:hypothetical protein